MKIQIDIDSELWGRFRSKVINEQGKTLAEVVPGVIEPALRDYLEPPPQSLEEELIESSQLPIIDRIITASPKTIPMAIRRCELCDEPTERLYALDGKKACYLCWKTAITTIPVPAPQTDTPPEAA